MAFISVNRYVPLNTESTSDWQSYFSGTAFWFYSTDTLFLQNADFWMTIGGDFPPPQTSNPLTEYAPSTPVHSLRFYEQDDPGSALHFNGFDLATTLGEVFSATRASDLIPDSGTNWIDGSFYADVIHARGADDDIDGHEGDDELSGGGGSDTINGGTGVDTALFSGSSIDYRFDPTSLGLQVTDLRAGSPDGSDLLQNVEFLKFTDGTFAPGALNQYAPAFSSGGAGSVAENTAAATVVYDANASDADATAANNTITYSLTGADAAVFSINAATGAVRFLAAPDFETPGDADGNNQYDIVVHANDGPHDTSVAISIGVANVAGFRITGTNGNDFVNAAHSVSGQPKPGGEEDAVSGKGGNDRLAGLDGDDRLKGGSGDDRLNGGLGQDKLDGGNGRDFFTFDSDISPVVNAARASSAASPAVNVDHIIGFSHAADTIELDRTIFKLGALGDLSTNAFYAATFAGTREPTGHDRSDRIIYNERDGSLWYDADRNKAHGVAAVEFAVLDGHPNTVDGSDFVVVA